MNDVDELIHKLKITEEENTKLKKQKSLTNIYI